MKIHDEIANNPGFWSGLNEIEKAAVREVANAAKTEDTVSNLAYGVFRQVARRYTAEVLEPSEKLRLETQAALAVNSYDSKALHQAYYPDQCPSCGWIHNLHSPDCSTIAPPPAEKRTFEVRWNRIEAMRTDVEAASEEEAIRMVQDNADLHADATCQFIETEHYEAQEVFYALGPD